MPNSLNSLVERRLLTPGTYCAMHHLRNSPHTLLSCEYSAVYFTALELIAHLSGVNVKNLFSIANKSKNENKVIKNKKKA